MGTSKEKEVIYWNPTFSLGKPIFWRVRGIFLEALGGSFGQLGCKNELKDGDEEAKEAKDRATTQRKTPRGAIRS